MQDKAKAYQRIRQTLTLFHLVLSPAILFLSIALPISLVLKGWAGNISENIYLMLGFYFLFFSLYMLIFDFPFAMYSGFFLEHQFDLSNQTFKAWNLEFLKKSILSFVLSFALLEALYALIWKFPMHWWIIAWAGSFEKF